MTARRDVVVRVARPEEFAPLAEIVVAAYKALGDGHLDAGYERELRAVERRAAEAVVLAALDASGRLAGCVTYVPGRVSPWSEGLHDGEAGIRMLAVEPRAQGAGAGEALTVACIDRARADGKRAIALHSTPWMTAAHRLYERLGFVRAADRDWTPVPEVPLLGYRLDLDLDLDGHTPRRKEPPLASE